MEIAKVGMPLVLVAALAACSGDAAESGGRTTITFSCLWSGPEGEAIEPDFLNPLIYLNDSEKYTLSIGLYAFFAEHDVAWGPLMAACVMFTIPALLIFIAGQRYFVGGVSTGALK
ncbi:carbohydrate ABC transporter permease [Nonomuraea angiospora]|uniref:ABC transporter permease n=1 Tax=Nonomuraea angiospora TaxID=46172 RepID=A0ABR9MLR1_9ACTN|nr:carbohydrate ABC transporter permease [Nonomuraea angiospora]MBE1593838.1 hypothetical protein [Nonomuraea angiospora]